MYETQKKIISINFIISRFEDKIFEIGPHFHQQSNESTLLNVWFSEKNMPSIIG